MPLFAFSFYLQQVVELEGYVIILVEGRDGKIKLYGSPADRDGLEVADEILDVNERKLDDVPRALVIKHIHEVRKTKSWDDKWGEGKLTGVKVSEIMIILNNCIVNEYDLMIQKWS